MTSITAPDSPHRKRSESLTIRLTPTEKEILTAKAAEKDMSITQYLLWCSSRGCSDPIRPLLKSLKQIRDLLEASSKTTRNEEAYDLLDLTDKVYRQVMEAVRNI